MVGFAAASLMSALPRFVAADLEPPFRLDLSHDAIEWTPGSSVELEATAYDYLPSSEKGTDEIAVTDKTSFEWSSSIGSLKASHNRATLSTPKIGGEGKVTVKAVFEGEQLIGTIGVKVCVNERSTPDVLCDTSPITPKSLKPTQTSTSQKEILPPPSMAPAIVTEPLSAFEVCISQILGGRRESTPADEPKIRECYRQSQQPLALSTEGELPVKPRKGSIKQLREAPEVFMISEPENRVRTDPDGKQETTLLLSGQGPATTTIYLYLFSETRVESTASDQNGAWSIEIIEPLEAGRHSLYILAKDQGGDFVRSKQVTFGIARAQATAENPEGKSLELVPLESFRPNYVPYLLGSFGLLLLIGLVVFIWRRLVRARLGKP